MENVKTVKSSDSDQRVNLLLQLKTFLLKLGVVCSPYHKKVMCFFTVFTRLINDIVPECILLIKVGKCLRNNSFDLFTNLPATRCLVHRFLSLNSLLLSE